MRKDELVAAVARRTGLSKAKARDAVVALFGTRSDGASGIISAELASGERVQIGGFGTFGTHRLGRHAEGSARAYFHAARSLRLRLDKSA